MTAPLDLLFWPRPRDEAGVLWGPRYTDINRAAKSTALMVGANGAQPWPDVGPEFIEWPQNIRVVCEPGAGQNVEAIDIGLADSAGNALVGLARRDDAGAADQTLSLDIQPKIALIGSRQAIRVFGHFNAAVNDNTVYLAVSSIVTIRGNVAMF